MTEKEGSLQLAMLRAKLDEEHLKHVSAALAMMVDVLLTFKQKTNTAPRVSVFEIVDACNACAMAMEQADPSIWRHPGMRRTAIEEALSLNESKFLHTGTRR